MIVEEKMSSVKKLSLPLVMKVALYKVFDADLGHVIDNVLIVQQSRVGYRRWLTMPLWNNHTLLCHQLSRRIRCRSTHPLRTVFTSRELRDELSPRQLMPAREEKG